MKRLGSKPVKILNSFISKDGAYYEYSVRLLGRRLMYSITCLNGYESYSIYDGEDFEDSFEIFSELAMILRGLSFAERFMKTKNDVQNSIDELHDKEQNMMLKVKPLFLGDSDFPNV